MVQLKILSGKMAGAEVVARHFPFYVGRAADCELSLDDPGVWDKHFQINLDSSDSFVLVAEANTAVIINGKSVQQTALRNGEIIEIGLAKILFGLSPTRQKSLTLREGLTWLALGGLCLSQLVLIDQLLR
ncbi:MAG: FHA domain-containing protein [Verrucomicrobiota bacterium]